MKETIEVIRSVDALCENKAETAELSADSTPDEPNYILRTQLCICLFLAGVIWFSWREGGELWRELSFSLSHILQDGISFSGQEHLTKFTDEVRGLLGSLVEAFAPVQ